MKKYFKYILVSILSFVLLIGSASATTIKETTINEDGYDTIESGTIVIGFTKFDSEVTITGAKAAKAGSNDAIVYSKLNGSLNDYEAPTMYAYYGVGGWYVLDEDNNSTPVEDEVTVRKLSNLDIYFVNNVEKKLDVDVKGIDVDTDNLPKGVTKEGNKLLVNATVDSFEIATNDGKKISFVKENGEFIENQSMCYTVSNGYITDYDNSCSSNVKIPSNIDGEDIIGVREAAFKNKGIKSVEIPASVMHLEDEAFNENSLESVIINGKYDQNDFITYGNLVFGDFTNITYKNDLTDLLDLFNDEVEIKVSQTAYDKIMDQDPHAIPFYMETSELNRLGLTEENGLTNGKYFIAFMYNDQLNDLPFPWNYEKIILKIDDVTNNKSVQKEVTYDLNIVNSSDNKYLNIESEYESYYNNLKQNYKNNLNSSITGIDKFYEIVDSYDYSAEIIGWGEVAPSELNDGLNNIDGGAECALIYNGILEDIYDISFISTLYYKMTGEGSYSTVNKVLDAYINQFKNETGITNYELIWKEDNNNIPSTTATDYSVSIEDNYNNIWNIVVNYKSLLGTYSSMTLNYYQSDKTYVQNNYTPAVLFEDYDGNLGSYISKIRYEIYNLTGTTLCGESTNEYCLTESFDIIKPYNDNSNQYGITLKFEKCENSYLNNSADEIWVINISVQSDVSYDNIDSFIESSRLSLADESYELDISPSNYNNENEYVLAAIGQFTNIKGISNYYNYDFSIDTNYFGLAEKNIETGNFSRVNSWTFASPNYYFELVIFDFDTGKTWSVYIPAHHWE